MSSRAPSSGDTSPLSHRRAWASRAHLLRAALEAAPTTLPSDVGADQLGRALSDVVDSTDRSHVWLTLAVLTGVLPTPTTVIETTRASEFDDGASLWDAVRTHTTDDSAGWPLRVATDEVLIDVAHTVATNLVTGIQRVVRATTIRWLRDHDATPISWAPDLLAMRELTELEHRRVALGILDEGIDKGPRISVVVPWRTTYLMPELGAEIGRTERLTAMTHYAGGRAGVIGYDNVPITSSETTAVGFASYFSRYLAALRGFDVVATISEAARDEFSGWARSLEAIGVDGPEIVPVALPVEIPELDPESMAEAAQRFKIGRLPLVLVVGSHEPRKNHLAVLHAAEILWREGVQFSLTFIGGNSWGGDAFSRRVGTLQRAGRPVDTESKLSDRLLWSAYRLAHFSVFPSLNEGFGLPLAESLAAGVPGVTSDFGSMREIAEGGGALMVDPHDDHAIADAMRTLLTDESVHARLTAEAVARAAHPRTWDDYAAEVWDALTGVRTASPG
jgi:glycosyltransferase involved in cell wall biosynthesis